MEKEFVTFGTAKVMVANISFPDAKELQSEIEGMDGVSQVEFTDEERQAFADACHEQVWPKLAQTFTQEFLDGVLNSAKAN